MTTESHVNVIVVGGGAAGLAAATAAEAAGLTCQLFEAQDRLGGRIRTVPLQSGGVFDEGAQMVNGDMKRLLSLAESAGLHLSPIPRTGIGLAIVGEDRLRAEELVSADELYDLLDDQMVRWDSIGEVFRALRLKLKWLTTPWESFGEAGRAARLFVEGHDAPPDSLAAALRAVLLSPEEHALAMSHLTEILSGPPEDINAHAVRDVFCRYGSERPDAEFQLAGGMGGIIDALAANLRHPPRLGTPVECISTVTDRVVVRTVRGVWSADHVVVTVPPPVARKITFDMEGSAELAALLSSFTAGDQIKTVLVFDTAFWRLEGCGGTALFGDPQGLSVLDGSLDAGLPPRLVTFLGGPVAREWAALPQDVRHARLLENLARAFGADALTPREVAEALWVDHPWSGGGYNASVRLDGNPDAITRLAAWPGRVRFAGAELDDTFWGYVEGALNSGHNAIARITGVTEHIAA